jgi:hypothetical protein
MQSRETDICDEIEALHRSLELKASTGAWADFGALLSRRNALLDKVHAADRREVYEQVLRSNARILEFARADRDAVSRGLEGLKQQRALTRYYESNGVT